MFDFRIIKKSKNSGARLGILRTSNGIVETPTLVAVATQASVKTLTSEEAIRSKNQMLICNTFHLHLKPGEKIIKENGGLHKFMNWPRSLMTDSGGYQVFSLGFGSDYKIGKILKSKFNSKIKAGQKPRFVKITEDGVFFISPINGDKLFIGPKESMIIQADLGADIIFAFDECPPPMATKLYLVDSVARTHHWAEICLDLKSKGQALYGIIQGGKIKDLRLKSARFIGDRPFDGFGIGGELGFDKTAMFKMLNWVISALPESKPRHLLGNGHIEDLVKIVKSGVDTIDCIIPTSYARHGSAFTSHGQLDMKKSLFLKDKKRLDDKCECITCLNYSRSYISHLVRAKEITGLSLLTFHNLFFFNSFFEQIRESIRNNKI